jgi:hypothetical protein
MNSYLNKYIRPEPKLNVEYVNGSDNKGHMYISDGNRITKHEAHTSNETKKGDWLKIFTRSKGGPTPNGDYHILSDKPKSWVNKSGDQVRFRIDGKDGAIDDRVKDSDGYYRTQLRIHGPGTSIGCIGVDKSGLKRLSDISKNTSPKPLGKGSDLNSLGPIYWKGDVSDKSSVGNLKVRSTLPVVDKRYQDTLEYKYEYGGGSMNFSDRLRKCFAKAPTKFDRDVNIIGRTIMAEGENQSKRGRELIADSIVNRSNRSGTSPVTEALKPKQYSCWNGISEDQRSNPSKIPYRPHGHAAKSPDQWSHSMSLASNIVNKVHKPTSNATHYHRVDMKDKPSWSEGMKDKVIEGDHIFGNTK